MCFGWDRFKDAELRIYEIARNDNEDVDTGDFMRDRTRHAKPLSETKYGEGPDYEDEPGV